MTYLLGSAATALLAFAMYLYSAIGPVLLPSLVYLLASTSALLGLCTGFALLCDVLAVLAWPVGLMYVAMAKVYALQLHYLGVTWRLMRGNHQARGCHQDMSSCCASQGPRSAWCHLLLLSQHCYMPAHQDTLPALATHTVCLMKLIYPCSNCCYFYVRRHASHARNGMLLTQQRAAAHAAPSHCGATPRIPPRVMRSLWST